MSINRQTDSKPTVRENGIFRGAHKKIKETPDLTIKRKKYKMDLVPPILVGERFFSKERDAVEALQAEQEIAARELKEFVEEHTGEESLLEDATDDHGKVIKGGVRDRLKAIKGGVRDRLKAIKGEPESNKERDALTRCLQLIEAETRAGKAVKEAQTALDANVLARYAKLTETEVKTLAIEDKWFASLRVTVEDEVERLTQRLAGRLIELDERYFQPLPKLEQKVEELSAKVEGNLKTMRLAWK